MKKITSLLFIALLSSGLNAQSLLPIKYGIKIGTNIANISSTQNDGASPIDNSAQIGVAGGFYMEIPLNDKWYLNPELIYAQKGASFTYDYTHNYPVNEKDEYTTTNTLKLAYVEINPTISYKASQKLALNFGPSVAFLIQVDSTFTEKLTSEAPASTTSKATLYESESLDVGLNLGVSYYLTVNFVLESKVNTGFMSIGKVSKVINPGSSGNTEESNIYDLKNRGIVFSIAYLF
jgi:long-subunit fatty acid transport protein